MNCDKCQKLRAELAEAERIGDQTRAVDCRVLLRRHPQHDGVPVSVQELVNLSAPRAGNVDPDNCIRCATLRKKAGQAISGHDLEAVYATAEAMTVHMKYGHPEDRRKVEIELPGPSPRISS
ncbi:hypothetical protein [Streptomyces sp. NEAU-L66]|uniref:hypothetical protein n=1 Tax=Streptomyces sp. NEAU-L66 TaxID=3390812 RepID=UPI0039C612AD